MLINLKRNIQLAINLGAQIVFSKYHFPPKGTSTPWRNGYFRFGVGYTQIGIKYLIIPERKETMAQRLNKNDVYNRLKHIKSV